MTICHNKIIKDMYVCTIWAHDDLLQNTFTKILLDVNSNTNTRNRFPKTLN